MGYARPEELFVGKPVGSGAPSQRLEQNDQARAGEKQEIPLRWLGIEPDDATGGEEEEKKMVNHLNRPIRSGTISRKPRRSIFSRTNSLEGSLYLVGAVEVADGGNKFVGRIAFSGD